VTRTQVIWKVVAFLAGLIALSLTLVSPARGETWNGQEMKEYIEKQQLSLLLSPFHPYPPAYYPAARPRVCMRPPGETGKRGRFTVPPPGNERRDARGNGRLVHHSLFCRSGSTPGFAQVRATARPVAGSVGLPGLAQRSRPGATWREGRGTRRTSPVDWADFSNNGYGLDGRGHNDRSTCHEG
jgi:hypothetical protein